MMHPRRYQAQCERRGNASAEKRCKVENVQSGSTHQNEEEQDCRNSRRKQSGEAGKRRSCSLAYHHYTSPGKACDVINA
jgi:hypothetical protein